MSNKNSYYNHNTLGRTALDNVLITVKFKSVFPTYKEWEDNLLAFKIPQADINETDYNYLQVMIGNAFLKFTTANKNMGYISFKFKEFLAYKVREKNLYDKDVNGMLTESAKNTQKFFTVNRSDITGDVEDKFLNNSATSDLETTSKFADYIEQIKEWEKLKNPEQTFLIRLANAIVLPYQAKESYEYKY